MVGFCLLLAAVEERSSAALMMISGDLALSNETNPAKTCLPFSSKMQTPFRAVPYSCTKLVHDRIIDTVH